MKPIIMIPAYNPDEKLLTTIGAMREAGFEQFVLIDDGSRPDCRTVFEAAQKEGCDLVRHAINLGKGRALKTGFNYVLAAYPETPGVITMDADGQHPPQAAVKVAQTMERHPEALVLGVRQFFRAKNIPLSNMLGNTITRLVFRLLTGLSFGDTQCGLRGFPRSVMKALLPVAGDRFEYENIMLLKVRDFRIDVAEVPMEAVYIGDNESSHFNKMTDSIRIYSHLIGYAAVPLTIGILSFLLYREFSNPIPCWWWADPLLWSSFACGITTLMGWLILELWLPDRKFWAGLGAGILCGGVHAVLYGCLFVWAGLSMTGSWWLAALPVSLLSYRLWLYIRHGKKPLRYREG